MRRVCLQSEARFCKEAGFSIVQAQKGKRLNDESLFLVQKMIDVEKFIHIQSD